MLKRILLVVLCVLSVSYNAYAASDRVGQFDAGINVSGLMPADDDVDNTFFVGGNLSYGLTPWLAVGFESGWAESDIEVSNVDFGEQRVIPVLGDVIVRLPNESALVPYGIVGVGALFLDFDESSTLNAAGVSLEGDTGFAVKVGGGVDYFLNENWIVNFEAGYVFSDVDVTASAGAFSLTDSYEADYWTIGGGIKYLFS